MDKISDAEHAQAEIASDFLSAMANPKRLLILKVLVGGEIAVAPVQELHQVVLDLDVVVGAPEAEAGGGFDGGLGLVVQLPDQRAEVEVHSRHPLTGSESCRPGRG